MNETHLIDGAMGRPHVNALDIRMHNASLFGDGVYITEGLDGLPVTVVDANTVSVRRGVMLINGARITQEEKIDLTIESGSQGMNRNDLLVATYTYDAANTRCEDMNLEIVTGTPTAGTATDPAIHSGTLLDINSADLVEGMSTVQVPIARIPLTGTTVGAPAILAKKFGTIQDIRDSVSRPLFKTVKCTSPKTNVASNEVLEYTGTLKSIEGYTPVGIVETNTNHDWSFGLMRATLNGDGTFTCTWMNFNKGTWNGSIGYVTVLYIRS